MPFYSPETPFQPNKTAFYPDETPFQNPPKEQSVNKRFVSIHEYRGKTLSKHQSASADLRKTSHIVHIQLWGFCYLCTII